MSSNWVLEYREICGHLHLPKYFCGVHAVSKRKETLKTDYDIFVGYQFHCDVMGKEGGLCF